MVSFGSVIASPHLDVPSSSRQAFRPPRSPPVSGAPLIDDTSQSPDGGGSPSADPATSTPPWSEIRAAYEGSDLAVGALAQAYGVSTDKIRGRAKRGGWRRRRPSGEAAAHAEPLDRNVLVARLFRAVERQIAEVERRFEGAAPPSLEEKDARTLGALARTLELLIGLEKQAGRDTTEPEPDIDEFRLDLARRLESLRRAE